MKRSELMMFVLLLSALSIFSCKIEPEAIRYGEDQCNFSKMNIIDKTHATQFVTAKGKQFKYDAIECMIREISRDLNQEIAIKLVSDFSSPGEMIPAEEAIYIISPKIKSPMGANLSAVKDQNQAEKLVEEFTGELYNWGSVQSKILTK